MAVPSWSSYESAMNSSPGVVTPVSMFGPSPAYGPPANPSDCTYACGPGFDSGPQPTMFLQGGQAGYPSRTFTGTQMQTLPMRPLLPRTETVGATSPLPASVPAGASTPHMQGSQRSHGVVSSVSTMTGQPQYEGQRSLSPNELSGQPAMVPLQASTLPYSAPRQTTAGHSTQQDFVSHSQYAGPVAMEPYDSSKDFDTFFDLDPAHASASPLALRLDLNIALGVMYKTDGRSSYMPGFDISYSMPTVMPGNFQTAQAQLAPYSHSGPEHSTGITKSVSPDRSAQPTGERDERKYRTDQLYFRGPHDDGLYHCPKVGEVPSCNHKPTTLKCQYEYDPSPPSAVDQLTDNVAHHSKYIDTHLKPFICKVGQCDDQKFSSTACLLRHEREAHGMHGHGDKPFLCLYDGCDRSVEGSGFPRRYNWLDHMKRVHDYVPAVEPVTVSNYLGSETSSQRNAGNRKRKSAAHPSAESAGQRQRTMPVPAPRAPRVFARPRMSARARMQSSQQAVGSQPMERTQHLVQVAPQVSYHEDGAQYHYATQGHAAELRRLSG